MRKVLAALGVLAAIPLLLALWFVYSRYGRYQPEVDRIVASITADERALSLEARQVIVTLEAESVVWQVTRSLLYEIAPARVGTLERHLRDMLWGMLLPHRFSSEELLLLYARSMRFEDGRGVSYGARKYFGKTPAQLTADDAIVLCVIARSPRAYSPTLNAERFAEALSRTRRRYEERRLANQQFAPSD
ncbi:MAG TPA: transglycosylase domain-containing protein [Thermoanaerobaculia bacterium]|nr:transglycosylase domain-containing protein [Thermoanaerobaculia bacterium]